jgi:hypothetical protein
MPQKVIRARSYRAILADVAALLEEARHASARTVNSIMTARYRAIGRRIIEEELDGRARIDRFLVSPYTYTHPNGHCPGRRESRPKTT